MIISILIACLLFGILYGRCSLNSAYIVSIVIALIFFVLKKKSKLYSLSLDMLVQRSCLLSWNAGLKIFGSIFILLFCIIVQSIWVSITVIIMMSMIMIKTTHLTFVQYTKLLLVPLSFLIVSGLILLIEISPKPLGLINIPIAHVYISITKEAQQKTMYLLLKAMGAVCCLYTLSLSTPIYDLTYFFKKIHIPTVMIELSILIYRYIFILEQSLHQMKIAAQVRMGYQNYRNSWRSFSGIASNLLVRSFVKANRSFDAMEARGYHEKIEFLVEDQPIQFAQLCLIAIVCIIPIVALLAGRNMNG